MASERRLNVPSHIPDEFAHAVATVLLLGIAEEELWDKIYEYPAETSQEWIEEILRANDLKGLVHADPDWWRHQLRGH